MHEGIDTQHHYLFIPPHIMVPFKFMRYWKKLLFSTGPKKIGWFWSILVVCLCALLTFLLRVYIIATRDPGGKAGEIGRECRERRDPNAGNYTTLLLYAYLGR